MAHQAGSASELAHPASSHPSSAHQPSSAAAVGGLVNAVLDRAEVTGPSITAQARADAGVFESTVPLPPIRDRMRSRHGPDQTRRECLAAWRTDRPGEQLLPGIVRFRDPGVPGDLAPNPALVRPLATGQKAPHIRTPLPRFAELASKDAADHVGGYTAIKISIELAEVSLYGTGEVAGSLLRNGTCVTCWNWDRPAYDAAAESLYQSHPWVLGVRGDGTAFGVLCETTRCCEIDLRKDITFRVEHPEREPGRPQPLSVIVIEGATPAEVVTKLAEITGRIQMPPRWALGYHQSRWSYFPEARVKEVARDFRHKMVPCDAIWFDIDYMDGYRVFTVDRAHFPDIKGLNAWLHQHGFHTVYMIDPGVRVDDADRTYTAGHLGNHFVRDEHGKVFHGLCWPGRCAWPDFTRQRTRDWWASLYKDFMALGVDGVWNDMNEPAVFQRRDNASTMPDSLMHEADDDLGGPGPHRRYHNIYGMQMVRATRDGIANARPDRRPFVLTRSSFIGGHRYAATWTGDNVSSWTHLAWSIPMVLNLGLSGQPFSGPDIGGFCDNATGDLMARWMGIGALLPFARGHTSMGTTDHEPWFWGEQVLATCRHAIERRMRLIPYLYTLFWQATITGLPVARPLFFADPRDLGLRDADDAFLLGGDVLVRCSHARGLSASRSRLPHGTWRRFELIDRAVSDHDLPTMHLRPGAIVPVGPMMQHTAELPLDPLTLLVSLDDAGRASGVVYEDAGDGHDHRDGAFAVSRYEALAADGIVTLRLAERVGSMTPPTRVLRVELLTGDLEKVVVEGRDGQTLTIAPPGAGPAQSTPASPPAVGMQRAYDRY